MVGTVVHKWSTAGEGTSRAWGGDLTYLVEVDGKMLPMKATGLKLADVLTV